MTESEAQEKDFDESPRGWARRWNMELAAARKELKEFHERAEEAVKQFLDERDNNVGAARWNLYWSGISLKRAIVYGETPKVSVDRRWADADDDVGRVAGDILDRLLNGDIERDEDPYALALQYALNDILLTGLGVARVRYEFEEEAVTGRPAIVDEATGAELAPAIPDTVRKKNEEAATDYFFWRDVLWGVCRVWHETPWVAFCQEMSRAELVRRFGEAGRLVPLNAKKGASGDLDAKKATPWSRAKVWEIWHKESGQVFWHVEGQREVLDMKPDTLGLDGFFPCPRPMMANLTTSRCVPTPDFHLTKPLYREINEVTQRIQLLQQAIQVRGAYDASAPELKQLLSRRMENALIPVENWASFAEKNGLAGKTDWMPIDAAVNALQVLRDYRRELVDNLFQVEGMADIMRGQASAPNVTATEQAVKAQFGSARMQSLQNEFARFASDIQKLKAEIIAKHFEPETILQRCNCENTKDAALAPQAVQLLKSEMARFRISVKPEAVSLTDFAALRNERMELLNGVGSYLQVMGGASQQIPGFAPFGLQILQGMVAGIRGSSAVEAVLDQAVAAAQKQAEAQAGQPPPPNPEQVKLQAVQLKGQMDLQREQLKQQGDMQRIAAEVQADGQREQTQAVWNTREAAMKAQISAANRPPKPNGGLP